jgi:hypothetical protein
MTKNIPHRIRKLIPVVLAVFFVVGPAATVIAGNTTDSPPITLTVNNGSSTVDIRQNRPRLYLTDERMALLRSKCCLDENGNVIAGCTPTDDWTEFKELIDRGISYPTQAWHWALIYMMNHDPSYAQEAINQTMDAIINAPRDGFNKNYLNANDVIRRVTLVYDWLYDLLTPQQRATMRDYVNMLLTEIWNPFDNETNTWSGWGINNPGNNFYYEFILCTTLAGIAFAYDNPNPPTLPFNGTDYTDILEFLDAKLNQQAIPEWLNLHGRGGGWHEGSHYMLTALRKFYEALLVLRDAGGTDYFTTLNFPRENTLFQIYIIQPGRKVVSPGGDMAMDAAGSINAYERQVWYLLADGLQGTPESEYIEYVIHNVPVTPSFNYQVTWAHRFLLYNPNLPMRNFNQLPLSYFANGLGWVNSRSSWADLQQLRKTAGAPAFRPEFFHHLQGRLASGRSGGLLQRRTDFRNRSSQHYHRRRYRTAGRSRLRGGRHRGHHQVPGGSRLHLCGGGCQRCLSCQSALREHLEAERFPEGTGSRETGFCGGLRPDYPH